MSHYKSWGIILSQRSNPLWDGWKSEPQLRPMFVVISFRCQTLLVAGGESCECLFWLKCKRKVMIGLIMAEHWWFCLWCFTCWKHFETEIIVITTGCLTLLDICRNSSLVPFIIFVLVSQFDVQPVFLSYNQRFLPKMRQIYSQMA